MKSIRLNIRALAFDGKTPLPAGGRITYNSSTHCHELGGGPLAKYGLLRMKDLIDHDVIAASNHVYVSWVGHSGQAGVTSFAARSYHVTQGRKVSTSPARDSNPGAHTGPVGPFTLRPTDELALTSNGGGEQIVALELLVGTAAEVEALIARG